MLADPYVGEVVRWSPNLIASMNSADWDKLKEARLRVIETGIPNMVSDPLLVRVQDIETGDECVVNPLDISEVKYG